jgi:hypothetical protein
MSEGKNLSLQRCSSLKGLASRRKQRENDREHVAEKLQRRLNALIHPLVSLALSVIPSNLIFQAIHDGIGIRQSYPLYSQAGDSTSC